MKISQNVYGLYLLSASVCNFPIGEVWWFLFRDLKSFVPLVCCRIFGTAISWMLICSLQPPKCANDPLVLWVRWCSNQILRRPPQSWSVGCPLHSSLSLLRKRPWAGHILLITSCASFCLHWGRCFDASTSQWALSCPQQLSSIQNMLPPHKHSKSGKTETRSLRQFSEKPECGCIFHSCLSSQGRTCKWGFPVVNCVGLWVGADITEIKWLFLPA